MQTKTPTIGAMTRVAPATIKRTDSTITYYVEVSGVDYKVVHRTWGSSQWQTTAGEQWDVHSSQGIHQFARMCDPAKPTYTRVLAAVKLALAMVA